MARILSRSDIRRLLDSLVREGSEPMPHSTAALTLYSTARHCLDGRIPWGMLFEVDRWPDYTAVLCYRQDDSSVLAHTKNSVCLHWTSEEGLRRLLTLSSIDWTKPLMIAVFPLSGLPVLKDHLQTLGIPYPENINICDAAYYLHKTSPSVEENRADDTVTVAPLKPEHSHLVNSTWRHGGRPSTEEYLKYLITTFPTACVYNKDGNPISWVLMGYHGALGIGYTLPEHRRKGYFQLASTYMIDVCLKEGYLPFLFIEAYNEASRNAHRKLGYTWEEAGKVAFIPLNRSKSS